MPSVMEAAINSAEANSSFSPCALLKRVVDKTQISRGMQRMRTNVMEFGRFTGASSAVCLGNHENSVV